MNILLLEPFFTGSHRAWARGFAKHSRNSFETLTLSGHHWKWRMHGGAVTLARKYMEGDYKPDLLLATDMLDLTTFLALTRERTAGIPTATYFHENQLTYPWSPKDRDKFDNRDRHYSFINYVTALVSDRVFFNSRYHHDAFLGELPGLLKQFPDNHEANSVEVITKKSDVLPLGLDLRWFDEAKEKHDATQHGPPGPPRILWNHRWEYDKNPEEFFRALNIMVDRELEFEVAVIGESPDVVPNAFNTALHTLGTRIAQFGYVDDDLEYARWLWSADLLPVTSIQDFFGGSVMEAIYCNCFPILPRRLAYPELIPSQYQSTCLYRDFDEFVDRLDASLRNVQGIRRISLRDVAAKYDWSQMASIYDEAFENVSPLNSSESKTATK